MSMKLIDVFDNTPANITIGNSCYTFMEKSPDREFVIYTNDKNDKYGIKLFHYMKRIEYDPPNEFQEVIDVSLFVMQMDKPTRIMERVPYKRWELFPDDTINYVGKLICGEIKRTKREIEDSFEIVEMENKEREEKINILKGFFE